MLARNAFVIVASATIGSFTLAADLLVPQDVSTIQGAIDIAAPGDRVLIAPGTYLETIDFLGKDIVVEGAEGAEATIIDGGGAIGHVVTFATGESRAAVLRGVTVTGGFGSPGSLGAGPGGGIQIVGAAPTIEACIVAQNAGIEGGGLSSVMGDPLVVDTRFELNHAVHGGGIFTSGGSISVLGSEFDGNMATNFGGAIAIFGGVVTEIADSEFTGNASNSLGGAIYTNTTTLNATRLTFVDNGEGMPLEGYGNGFVYSTFGGGAIYTTNSAGRLDASRLVGNTAYAGAGLYVAGTGTLEFVNCLLTANVSALGAVYCNAASPSLVNCTIVDNEGFGIFTTFGSFPTAANTIIAGHSSVGATEIAGNGETMLSNSLVEGVLFSIAQGSSVISAAPLLDENFAPLPGSPAIDAGDNGAVPADVLTDLLGNVRVVDDPETEDSGTGNGNGNGPIVDIGAIEFGSAPPTNAPIAPLRRDSRVLLNHGDSPVHAPAKKTRVIAPALAPARRR